MLPDLMALELAVCHMVESMPDAQTLDADEMRARLRPLCDDAIRLGIRAERFVMLLKRACRQTSPKSRFRAEFAPAPGARLVSLAIDEYYMLVDRADAQASRTIPRSSDSSVSEYACAQTEKPPR